MNIEYDIFKRSKVNFSKLTIYGFIKNNNNYILEKIFFNDKFKAIITIDNKGSVSGKVIDIDINEEYTPLKTNLTGEYVSKVREAYKDILIDIKNNICDTNYFIFDQTNKVNKYIKDKYNIDPEFLWEKTPGCGVYRNKDTNKWFGIIMNIDYSKLDKSKHGEVEVLNVKLDRNEIIELLNKNGYYKAYHMSKVDWISIILNDTLSLDEIASLIDKSYNLVK